MDIYKINRIRSLLSGNSYVGRGIVLGKSENGKNAVAAYFIMGRSENSRNRVFVREGNDEIKIYPFDESKVEDPSLIIYAPVRTWQNNLIVTNGDQTDTIRTFLREDKTFEQALDTRCFEPDYPNFTPRISGMITFTPTDFTYKMSILKSADADGSACSRYTFSYSAIPGLGHFLHTYICDGNPIPTFAGEPERVVIPDSIDDFTSEIWDNLDEQNKISLYVRYCNLETGAIEDRLINKNTQEMES